MAKTEAELAAAVERGLGWLADMGAPIELVDPDVAAHFSNAYLAEKFRARRDRAPRSTTPTPRELDCLTGAAHGLRDREIAEVFGIGEQTVKTHLKRVFVKLRAKNRSHAVANAIRRGLIV